MIEWLSIDTCTNICCRNRWLQIEPNIYALISSFNCISLIARDVGVYFPVSSGFVLFHPYFLFKSSWLLTRDKVFPCSFSFIVNSFIGRSALVLYSPLGFCLYVFLSALWCCSGCSRRSALLLTVAWVMNLLPLWLCHSSPWLDSLCTCSVSDAHSATTGFIAPLFYVLFFIFMFSLI